MKKITASILTTLLMLSMVFSSSVFAANEETSAWDSFLGLFSAKASADDVGVEYRGHIQNVGDYPTDGSWIQGPERLGTVGKSLRLEAFWIKLTDAPEGLHIKYEVHVQNIGWMAPVEDGKLAGTQGDSLRIEAIKISLVDDEGNVSGDYTVTYKGHIQNVGDTAWIKSGQQLGTTGSGLRLEALEVKIEKIAPDLTDYEAALAAVTEANYTKASWAAYQDVVEDNVMTEDNVQSEVDAATAIILDAQEDLVTVPVISGMTATAQKTITVTGTELSKLSASMFTVANNTVTAVTPNADGTSATLTLGTDLVPDTNTKVTATIDGTAKDYTVKYTIAAITVAVQDGTYDDDLADQRLTVLVNGVVTTTDYLVAQGYTVKFDTFKDGLSNSNLFPNSGGTPSSSSTSADGKLVMTANTVLNKDYKVQVTIAKGSTVVTSTQATIKIRDLNNNVSDISSYTLKTTNETGNTDTTTITSGTLAYNQFARFSKVVVGYGSAAAELTSGFTVESDNTAVISVTNQSGIYVMKAVGVGTANVTITVGNVTKVVPLTVSGTARVATTVALADNASQFTYVIGNNVANVMTVVVKDQYGDLMSGNLPSTINFTIPTNITGLTATSSTITTVNTTTGKATITLENATTAGQTGNVVFRNTDNVVIGSAQIATSNNNTPTKRVLYVEDGSTDNVINTDLTSKSTIKFGMNWVNSNGVKVNTVADVAGYKATYDPSIISITGATLSSGTTYTLGTGQFFTVNGLKAGSTTLLIQAADGTNIDSRTITVQNGEVKITDLAFKSVGTVGYIGDIKYTTALDITEVTGKDDIVKGVTLSPSSVFAVRIVEADTSGPVTIDGNGNTAIVTAGTLYLDKNGDGAYSYAQDGRRLATVTADTSNSTGTVGFNTITNVISGLTTKAGNKGNMIFTVTDLITSGTPTLKTSGIAIDVPVALVPLTAKTLTADTSDNSVDNDLVINYTPDAAFNSAITAVKVGTTTLTPTTDYVLGSGTITLKPSGNAVLQSTGNKTITVVATGYYDSTVTQTILAGAVNSLTVTQAPVLAVTGGNNTAHAMATQPIITLKDQYNNTCTNGVSANADVSVAINGTTTPAGAVLSGTTPKAAAAGAATFTDLAIAAGSTAAITDLDLTFTCGTKTVQVTNLTAAVS